MLYDYQSELPTSGILKKLTDDPNYGMPEARNEFINALVQARIDTSVAGFNQAENERERKNNMLTSAQKASKRQYASMITNIKNGTTGVDGYINIEGANNTILKATNVGKNGFIWFLGDKNGKPLANADGYPIGYKTNEELIAALPASKY